MTVFLLFCYYLRVFEIGPVVLGRKSKTYKWAVIQTQTDNGQQPIRKFSSGELKKKIGKPDEANLQDKNIHK